MVTDYSIYMLFHPYSWVFHLCFTPSFFFDKCLFETIAGVIWSLASYVSWLTNLDFTFLILILLGCWFFLHVFIVSLIQNHYFHILLQMSCTFSCYNRINRHLAYTTMQKMLNLLNQRIMSVVVYIVLFKNWVFKLNYQCRYVIMFWPK